MGEVEVLSGARVDQLERELGGDQILSRSLGVGAVFRGSLTTRRDSLMLFVAMFDAREQRYVRSFRSLAPRSNPAQLTGTMATLIRAWLRPGGRTPGR